MRRNYWVNKHFPVLIPVRVISLLNIYIFFYWFLILDQSQDYFLCLDPKSTSLPTDFAPLFGKLKILKLMWLKYAESINTDILSHASCRGQNIWRALAKMHPGNCSPRQIYLTSKNLRILCCYASKPKFSYVATYFESFFPIFFFQGKKGAVATTSL